MSTSDLYRKLFGMSHEQAPDGYLEKYIINTDENLVQFFSSEREFSRKFETRMSCKPRSNGEWRENEMNLPPSFLKGVVVDKNLGRIIACGFPETEEVLPEDLPQVLKKYIPEGADSRYIPYNTKLTFAPEGQVVKIYYSEGRGEWMFSTNKKLDAGDSAWSGSTLGEIWDALWGQEDYDKYMFKTRCYVFLVSSTKNRVLCNNSDSLHLIAVTKQTKSGSMVFLKEPKLRVKKEGVVYPRVIFHRPERTGEELAQIVSKAEKGALVHTGALMTFNPGCDFKEIKCIKVLNPTYSRLISMRDADGIFQAQYTRLLCSSYHPLQMREFEAYFPEYKEDMEILKRTLPSFLDEMESGDLYYTNHTGYRTHILKRANQDNISYPYEELDEGGNIKCLNSKGDYVWIPKKENYRIKKERLQVVRNPLHRSVRERIKIGIRFLDHSNLINLTEDLLGASISPERVENQRKAVA